MKKRLLSLLLALALLLTVLPQLSLPTRAEDEPDPLIGADEVVLEEITYFGTRIETMRMLYRLAGEPEVEDVIIFCVISIIFSIICIQCQIIIN